MNNSFREKSGCIVVFLLALLMLLVIVSCSAQREIVKVKHPVRIALIPFQAVRSTSESGNTVVCPLCGAVYFGGKIAESGEGIVEELFMEDLEKIKEMEIIPQEKVTAVYKRVGAESLKMPLLRIITKTGIELDADLVAVGYVFRYVERIGYDYSVEKPASVAFEINLIDPRKDAVIWRNSFDKTQKSLMEDMFQIASFYKGGGKWLTVRELSKQGMDQAFKTFPDFEQ